MLHRLTTLLHCILPLNNGAPASKAMTLHGNPLNDAVQADRIVALHDQLLTDAAQASSTTA